MNEDEELPTYYFTPYYIPADSPAYGVSPMRAIYDAYLRDRPTFLEMMRNVDEQVINGFRIPSADVNQLLQALPSPTDEPRLADSTIRLFRPLLPIEPTTAALDEHERDAVRRLAERIENATHAELMRLWDLSNRPTKKEADMVAERSRVPDLRSKLEAHKTWVRGGAGGAPLYLRSADLSGVNLQGAVLSYTDLRDCDLSYCDLRNADLWFANLRGAILTGAILGGANLRKAVLPYPILQLGPMGSRSDYLVYKTGIDEIMTGCFLGTLDEFERAVMKEHGDNEHGRAYLTAIIFLRSMRGKTGMEA